MKQGPYSSIQLTNPIIHIRAGDNRTTTTTAAAATATKGMSRKGDCDGQKEKVTRLKHLALTQKGPREYRDVICNTNLPPNQPSILILPGRPLFCIVSCFY